MTTTTPKQFCVKRKYEATVDLIINAKDENEAKERAAELLDTPSSEARELFDESVCFSNAISEEIVFIDEEMR